MPITATLDGDTGILRVTLSGGWPTPHELAGFRRRMRTSLRLGDQIFVLGDLRGFTTDTAPAWHELWGSMQVPESSGGPRRYALLIRAELQHLGEMIEMLAPDSLEFRTFTDEAAAIAWLVREPLAIRRL